MAKKLKVNHKNTTKFNINYKVYVKLTEQGFTILKRHYGGEIPDWFEKNYNYGDNIYEFLLWELMHIFGQYVYHGNMNLPFETTIYFDKLDFDQ